MMNAFPTTPELLEKLFVRVAEATVADGGCPAARQDMLVDERTDDRPRKKEWLF